MDRTCKICDRYEKCIQHFSYKPKEKGPLQRSIRRWENNFIKGLKETRLEDVNCVQMVQDRVQEHVSWVPWKVCNFVTS
jgi:two-component SAPR family response regulator